MAEQKNVNLYPFKFSESKKYLYQILPNKGVIRSTTDLSIIKEFTHECACTYIDIYEFDNVLVFQFNDIEYWFDQTTGNIERHQNNIVFYQDFVTSKLQLKQGNEIVHTFGERVMFMRRTRNSFYCMHVVDEHYVIDMFRYELQSPKNITIIRRIVVSIKFEERLPEIMIDESTSRLFAVNNKVLRIYNMDTLEKTMEVPNVYEFSKDYAIINEINNQKVIELIKGDTIVNSSRPKNKIKHVINGDWLMSVIIDSCNSLRMYNLKTDKCLNLVINDIYYHIDSVQYIKSEHQLIWKNKEFKLMKIE